MEKAKQTLAQQFAAPGNEWRGKPFWSWNGELEADELLRQLHIIQEMGWGGHFMHSRSGLATEYLGEEWFRLINLVTDESERMGLESWLYDEDRWPSGSAGGKVTVDPQYRMRSLTLIESDPEACTPQADDLALWLVYLGEDGLSLWFSAPVAAPEEAAAVRAANPQQRPGSWKLLRFRVDLDACSSNYNGTTYIDTMNEGATRRFIELTHEEYQKHCGERIGSSIRGIFTDEPHRGHAMDNLTETDGVRTCQTFWTDDLPQEFGKRYGYELLPLLPDLFYNREGRRMAQVRLHYFDLGESLFLERFADPLNDWCNEHGIQFTGHVLHEDSLSNQTVPQGSLMRFYEHMGLPGVDVLTEGNRCYWVAKQLASTARQTGHPWMLSELYGCTGWQFDFRGHKAVGDWQALFGINLRCPHLSWYTMEGQSKRDYPASMLHQSPWYKDYSLVEDYFARFGMLMQAEPLCDVLVLNPIESVWAQAHLGWSKWIYNQDPEIEKTEKAYTDLFAFLTGEHIDFDYGDEEMLSRLAAVETAADGSRVLRVGKMRYRTVIVAGMLTMRPTTLALLQQWKAAGGSIVFAGEAPQYVGGLPSGDIAALAQGCTRTPFAAKELAAAVRAVSGQYVQVCNANGSEAQDVFVQVRRHAEGLYSAVVLNTDREAPRPGLTLTVALPGADGLQAQLWDMRTGARYAADALRTDAPAGCVSLALSLEAGGTCALVFAAEKEALPPLPRTEAFACAAALPTGDYDYTLDEENVCVLDFARWRLNGGDWHDAVEVLKADNSIRDAIGIERRGGEMLQPWYSKLHYTEEYGQLELEYTFDVETLPEGPVVLAGERPERMQYSVNGVPLTPDGGFWVDICFKRMPIPAGVLKPGRNVVHVSTTFTRNTNVEAVYLLGGFGVRIDGHAAALTTLPRTLHFGSLKEQGLPFYTGCLTYRLPGSLWANAARALEHDPRATAWLQPGVFHGALVRVSTLSGVTRLGWDPIEVDITDAVRTGADVELTLVGTRRNTFGPLHLVPAIDTAYGPGHFVTEGDSWDDDYVLIPSGLEGAALQLKQPEE